MYICMKNSIIMNLKNILPLSTFILLLACSPTEPENLEVNKTELIEKTEVNDLHSYSNINEVNTTHLHLDLTVNFDTKS